MRVAERFQHDLDFLYVDEADDVQRAFDEAFLQHEVLTDPDRGWSTRTRRGIADGLDRDWHMPLQNPKVQKYEELERRHGQARVRLYQLLVALEGEPLRTLLGEGPFTGHSILFRLARDVHGLGERQDFRHDADREDAAKEFFERCLEPLSSQPFSEPSEDFAPLLHAMTAAHDTGANPDDLALGWLRAHTPGNEADAESTGISQKAFEEDGEDSDSEGKTIDAKDETTEEETSRVRLLQAGIWAARITASFFEMGKLYPAVAEVLRLPEDLSFLGEQPPRISSPSCPSSPQAISWRCSGSPTRRRQRRPALVWLRGVGRWLLHHLHDLLAPEGIDGPNVILTSATSWMPTSPSTTSTSPSLWFCVLPRLPRRRSRQSNAPAAGPCRRGRTGIRLWNRRRPGPPRTGPDAGDGFHLRASARRPGVPAGAGTPAPGFRPAASPFRRAQHPRRRECRQLRQPQDPVQGPSCGPRSRRSRSYGLIRRRVSTFAHSGADILISSEGAIQRGHNILNARQVAALARSSTSSAFTRRPTIHPSSCRSWARAPCAASTTRRISAIRASMLLASL
ncbi:hypothetical protein NKH18_06805 [Streptomyces sp. M10(2022)]